MEELEEIILNLINKKCEGAYWDFKEKHHEKTPDGKVSLLHDILCMANNIENRDAYIIVGVEDKTWNVIGINSNDYRREQDDLIKFIRSQSYNGDIYPQVEMTTIEVCNVELDIITVKNTRHIPYSLKKNFLGKNGEVKLYMHYIYSREGDMNTPRDKQAPHNYVEYLWRKRFGIDINPVKKLKLLLEDYANWKCEERYCYNIDNPEFTIELSEPEKCDNEMRYFYCSSDMRCGELKVKYHTTILFRDEYWRMDHFR